MPAGARSVAGSWSTADRHRRTRQAPIGTTGRGSVMGMEFTPRRRLELVSGRSHPELAEDVADQLGRGARARPISASSPTARSTAVSTRRSGAATCSSSRPTADR